jgi:hypothetical protein
MKYVKKYQAAIFIVFFLFAIIEPAFFLFIFGSTFFFLGIYSIFFMKQIQKNGIECTGRILSYQSDSDGHKTPLVEFTPIGGGTIRKEPSIYLSTDLSKIKSYKNIIDREVAILYDPNRPSRFILLTEGAFNYLACAIVTMAGLIFILISVHMF